MPRLGRHLTCFYCGKRSSVRFDGLVRDFVCLHCDATNYLDENGDITDPPVAKIVSTVEPTQYVTTRHRSPAASTEPPQSIFCPTCLKNQHLFTASLAQYLPDDPEHPDYARLEKDYYKFRKGLEQRYPQICPDCFPKVQAQVDRAGYTARTDHLRRMMDKSRQRRATPKQWSPLNTVDKLGKWLWFSGLGMQLLWHFVLLSQLSSPPVPGPFRDPDEEPHWLQSWLLQVTSHLPSGSALISWSIYSSILGIWWNPRFVQVFRGFSKHVLGLSQWYAFQGLIMVVRLVGRRATDHLGRSEVGINANICLHGLLAIITLAFYWKGQVSVHIDTTPLFHADTSPISTPPRATAATSAQAAQKEDTQSLASMLDEIMQQTPKQTMEIPTHPTRSPLAQSTSCDSSNVGIGGLALSEQTPQVQYSEEMDWSPTQSKHRAFNDFGAPGRDKQGFNASPTNVDSGAFWYKVPPAPKAPLHKLATRSTRTIREKPAEPSSIFFPGNKAPTKAGRSDGAEGGHAARAKVDFAQPSFFAAPNTSDPRNTLAEILDSKFKIGHDEAEDDKAGSTRANGGTIELKLQEPTSSTSAASFVDAILLVALLSTWWCATTYGELQTFTRDVMKITMGLAVLVGMHMTRTAILDLQAARRRRKTLVGNVFLSISEVVACSLFLLQIWSTPDAKLLGEMATPGLLSLSVMVAHGAAAYLGPRVV